MRPLDDFLPAYEFPERHSLAIDAPADRIDHAVRSVSIADIPTGLSRILLLRAARRRAEAGT